LSSPWSASFGVREPESFHSARVQSRVPMDSRVRLPSTNLSHQTGQLHLVALRPFRAWEQVGVCLLQRKMSATALDITKSSGTKLAQSKISFVSC
jgi:hypothetical protein